MEGRVIAILQPILGKLLFGRSRGVAEFEGKRGNSLLDEAVLIAPDEQIPIRLLIRLNLYPCLFTNRANVIAQCRFSQSLHLQILQGE